MKLKLDGTATDEILAANGLSLYEEYERAIEAAAIPQGATVFDAATGSGRMTGILLKRGCNVVSGDIDREKLEVLKAHPPVSSHVKLELVHLNLEQLTYRNNHLHYIVCANAIHELKNPINVLYELKRVCSPAGVLVLIDFTSEGFDIIEQIMRFRKGIHHAHGRISREEVGDFLKRHFVNVTEVTMRLNWAYIARIKRLPC